MSLTSYNFANIHIKYKLVHLSNNHISNIIFKENVLPSKKNIFKKTLNT